ncbi:MAG TPA: hypothetical protein VF234_00065 [Limnochordia bacterium]
MIAIGTTVLAAAVALFGLTRLGLTIGQLFTLLWPVALGVALLCGFALGLGLATVRLITPRTTRSDHTAADAPTPPRRRG